MLEFKRIRKIAGHESSNNEWGLRTHETELISHEAAFTFECVLKWGMVAGDDGGEDSTGRAKLRLMQPSEVVNRAITMSELVFNAARRKGWMIDAGTIEEIEAELFPEGDD